MALPIRTQDRSFSYRDYLGWGDEHRYELIDGMAYLMAPAPAIEHQGVVGELFYQLRMQLEGHRCRPFVAPVDVRLPKVGQSDDEADTVVQPDVFVICDSGKIDARGVRGAPDFVVEVLSPATAARDQIDKKKIYERAGVREYWLVHPTDRLVTIYRAGDAGYGAPEILELSGETPIAALTGVAILWEPIVRVLGPRAE
jgi:Uma2 family endonuclease